DLVGIASWENPTHGERRWETTTEKVRNVSPIKINEFRTGTSDNATNAFIELSNTGATAVDLSHWTLTEHPAQQAVFSTVTLPPATMLPAGGHYLLGLSNSGLAAPARPGDTTINVRSTAGMNIGDPIVIGSGRNTEVVTIKDIPAGGAAGPRV